MTAAARKPVLSPKKRLARKTSKKDAEVIAFPRPRAISVLGMQLSTAAGRPPTKAQQDARRAVLDEMLKHNAAPTAEELAIVRAQWKR